MNSTRLSVGDFGNGVERLHETLQQQGLTISPGEQKRKFFGPTTREAVGKFQVERGLERTCDVCEKTAAELALAARSTSAAGGAAELHATAGDDRSPVETGNAAPGSSGS